MAAVDALRLVHAKACAAYYAGPLGCVLGRKALHSNSLDAPQIGDDANSVFCAIAAVKMQQISAREFGAGKAELMATGEKLPTVFDGTSKAGVRLVAATSPATGARVVISNECAA